MLTRLLAESFGGSSKTCLVITCSVQSSDREETRCSLEFGKRAKLVRNRPQINLEVAHEPSAVVEAFVAKKLEEMQRVQEELLRERELFHAERAGRVQNLEEKLEEAIGDMHGQQNSRLSEVAQLEDQKAEMQERLRAAVAQAVASQDEAAVQATKLQSDRKRLHTQLLEARSRQEALQRELQKEVQSRAALEAEMRAQLAERQRQVEDATKQAADLRLAMAELGREKAASLARLEEQNAEMRSKWLEDVSRLEAEKRSAQLAASEAQSRLQENRCIQEMPVQYGGEAEAEAPASLHGDPGFEESNELQLASRSAELRKQLEAITADGEQLEKLRQARLLCLEVEAQDLQAKWQQQVPEEDTEQKCLSRSHRQQEQQLPFSDYSLAFQALPSFPTELPRCPQFSASHAAQRDRFRSNMVRSDGSSLGGHEDATADDSQGIPSAFAWRLTEVEPTIKVPAAIEK
ncbi:unnamed protein product [Effrenium voratum]|nr:unnamed protein product [Effrenium voratum]